LHSEISLKTEFKLLMNVFWMIFELEKFEYTTNFPIQYVDLFEMFSIKSTASEKRLNNDQDGEVRIQIAVD